MDNIFIYSNDVFARKTIVTLLAEVGFAQALLKDTAIFIFGGNNISQQEMMLLLECKAERVLILTSLSLIKFFASVLPGDNIIFERYDTSIFLIQKALACFIQPIKIRATSKTIKTRPARKLTFCERRVTALYIQGLPLACMARLLNTSIKTVSAQRRRAMKKMGVVSNIEFLQKGNLMRLLEQNIITSFA